MAGYAICPYCKQTVQPFRDARGVVTCPLCTNLGAAPATPQWAPAGTTGFAAPPPAAVRSGPQDLPGATSALVMGILALAIPYIGFIFAFIGLSQGKKALRLAQGREHQFEGVGRAKAGRVCSIISLAIYGVVLLIVGAAVVFVLISNLSKDPDNSTIDVVLAALA